MKLDGPVFRKLFVGLSEWLELVRMPRAGGIPFIQGEVGR